MRFQNEVLYLGLAIAIASDSTAAFVPPSRSLVLRMDGGRQERNPADLIPELKLKSAFTLTNTLRWEIRSTLTSNEEAASQTEDSSPQQDIPEYPEMASTGIYEIMSPDQHR
jgi:hypothetical protein